MDRAADDRTGWLVHTGTVEARNRAAGQDLVTAGGAALPAGSSEPGRGRGAAMGVSQAAAQLAHGCPGGRRVVGRRFVRPGHRTPPGLAHCGASRLGCRCRYCVAALWVWAPPGFFLDRQPTAFCSPRRWFLRRRATCGIRRWCAPRRQALQQSWIGRYRGPRTATSLTGWWSRHRRVCAPSCPHALVATQRVKVPGVPSGHRALHLRLTGYHGGGRHQRDRHGCASSIAVTRSITPGSVRPSRASCSVAAAIRARSPP